MAGSRDLAGSTQEAVEPITVAAGAARKTGASVRNAASPYCGSIQTLGHGPGLRDTPPFVTGVPPWPYR